MKNLMKALKLMVTGKVTINGVHCILDNVYNVIEMEKNNMPLGWYWVSRQKSHAIKRYYNAVKEIALRY